MRHRHRNLVAPTHPLLRVLMASPTQPTPEPQRRHELTVMWAGLASIERAPWPTLDDWRACSDAVNYIETLVLTMRVAEDTSGLLDDASVALAGAGRRFRGGMALRLDAPGIRAVRAVLEAYEELLQALPERTILEAKRLTERRIREIVAGKRQAHDVEVMNP